MLLRGHDFNVIVDEEGLRDVLSHRHRDGVYPQKWRHEHFSKHVPQQTSCRVKRVLAKICRIWHAEIVAQHSPDVRETFKLALAGIP